MMLQLLLLHHYINIFVVVVVVGEAAIDILHIILNARVATVFFPEQHFSFLPRKVQVCHGTFECKRVLRIYYGAASIIAAILQLSSSQALLTSCQ